jgi:hypothetical protein
MTEPDPRLIKLVRDLSEERERRVKAERDAGQLRARLRKLRAQYIGDAKPQHEDRPTC